jgi:hypothetical protein
MAYRDDLEAALAHAEAAERELDEAKRMHAHDEERIAALEKQLASAKVGVKKAEAKAPRPKPQREPRGTTGLRGRIYGGFVLFAAASAIAYMPVRDWWLGRVPRGNDNAVMPDDVMPLAIRRAQSKFPDAELLTMSAPFVDDKGWSRLAYGGEVSFKFRSPSLAVQLQPSAPALGAPAVDSRKPCTVSVWLDKDSGLTVNRPRNYECGPPMPLPALRCTVRQIRGRARDAGAPAGALATVRLTSSRKWSVDIEDQTTHYKVFSRVFPDDCQ